MHSPPASPPATYVGALTSMSAGMRALAGTPAASVAGYWPTVAPLSSQPLRGAQAAETELASARTMIRLAEERGAAQFAGVELERARGEIQSAKDLAGIDPREAQRLAQEANLDAQATLARVHTARARQAGDAAALPAGGLPAALDPRPSHTR